MTKSEIRDYIYNLTSHITFTYNDRDCGVDPISRDERYDMWYGNETHMAKSVDEVMNVKLFDGMSLNDIAGFIEID